MGSVSSFAPSPPPLAMATAASLQGQREASAHALAQAAAIQAAPGSASLEIGRALVQAIQAAPDMLGGLSRLHQRSAAYARAAALVRWSL